MSASYACSCNTAPSTTPADIDGLSLVPTLIGEATAGRAQRKHDFLYWEISGWTAIRRGSWRAVRPPKAKRWELYDLSTDPSEAHDVSAAQPKIVAELAALDEAAHEPVREGTFADTERHQRDRRAKYGKHDDLSYEATPSGAREKADPATKDRPVNDTSSTTSRRLSGS